MDRIVLEAMARWPHVPSVYGWLDLDCRGRYAIKGERIANATIQAFISRNYACDGEGRWYFQNGPQRVFVKLGYTPFVLRSRFDGRAGLVTHAGDPVADPGGAFVDDSGQLLISFGDTVGVVHDRDLPEVIAWLRNADGAALDDAELGALFAQGEEQTSCALALCGRRIPVLRIRAATVAARFGFDPDPAPEPGEPEC